MCLQTREHIIRPTAVQGQGQGKLNEDGRFDLQVSVQRLPQFVCIRETTRPLEVRLKEHLAYADKITKSRAFTQAEEFKSAIAEHAAIENHTLD